MDDMPRPGGPTPERIGRYRILEPAGFGAMGAVYKAFDPDLRRMVAVRPIRIGLGHEDPGHDSLRERFVPRARVLAEVAHPHLATLLDAGWQGDEPWVATEYVEGESLAGILSRDGRLDPRRVLALVAQVASALDHLHARDVLHLGIKPSNVIVAAGDDAKVTDFWMADLLEVEAQGRGSLLGTPSYMAPEQAMGEKLDGRSDVFSLGVCAFEMLSGQKPFPGSHLSPIVYRLVHVDPVEPAGLERIGLVPEMWQEVFGRVLAKRPEDRYPTAQAFADDLESCLAGGPPAEEELELGAAETVAFGADEAPEEEAAGCVVPVSAAPAAAAVDLCAPGPAPPLPLDENVQFTVYRPRRVEAMRWYPLLAFAHLEELPPDAPEGEPDPLQRVRDEAGRVLGDLADEYAHTRQDSALGLPHEAEITFVPELPGFEIRPDRRTFLWLEPVHREEFRIRASAGLEGRTARGRVTVFWGRIVLAEVSLAVQVGAAGRPADGKEERSAARPFRKIFPSYSHKDVAVVEELERYGRSLGDVYLRDVTQLRAGERWDQRLLDLIQEADVFQLFWSWNAMHSAFVEKEWRFALSLQRAHFIRPTYWEEPLPARPDHDLPPEALRRLHFQLLPAGAGKAGAHLPGPASVDEATVSMPRYSVTPVPAGPPPPRAPTESPTGRMRRPDALPAASASRPPGRGPGGGLAAAVLAGFVGAGVLASTSGYLLLSRRATPAVPTMAPSPPAVLGPPTSARGTPPAATTPPPEAAAEAPPPLPPPAAIPPPATSAPAPGRLRLAVPPGVTVTLDGEFVGVTPLEPLEVRPGEHTVVLSHPDYDEVRVTVRVAPGEVVLLEPDLRARRSP